MRELSALDAHEDRAAVRARIEAVERFRPEPRLVRKVGLTMLPDGFAEMDVKISGAPRRVHPMLVEMYRGLEEGAPLDDIVARATPLCPKPNPRLVEKLLRNYLLRLNAAGVVAIDFEEPPAIFHERYERVRELGRGGMGVVHLCADRADGGRLVVLKHAWGWATAIEKAEMTNRREAAALARLDHPLVPKLLDTFEDRGILHMVRAYADGEPLSRALGRLANGPAAHRLRIAADIADAIGHVHARGMLYLDAKPDNFILDAQSGRPVLLDMGLCRLTVDGVVRTRTPIGSRGYAAPEMLREREATARSDVYGLGRTLAAMAMGKKARQKHDAAALAPLLLAQGVGQGEVDLIVKLSATDAAERPADMREARIAIEAAARAASDGDGVA